MQSILLSNLISAEILELVVTAHFNSESKLFNRGTSVEPNPVYMAGALKVHIDELQVVVDEDVE